MKKAISSDAAALLLTAILACSVGCTSDRPATWEYISPVIFQPNCASSSCHSPGAAVGGLDFSNADRGYTSLTSLWVWIVDRTQEGQSGCDHRNGTTVCDEMFRPLVTPYDPQQSRLINMLRGRNALRMPPDRPLDEADIRLVESWILSGAKKNANDVVDASPIDGPKDAGSDAASDADGGVSDADAVGDAPPDGTPLDGGSLDGVDANVDAADGAGG